MIPLWSSERTYSPAVVTLLIIVVNVMVFAFELTLPDPAPGYRVRGLTLSTFITHYGIVPDRLHATSLITSMFLHGGLMHIVGNMWFLWVFGKGIEDLLGHVQFMVFYLLSGIAAGLVQTILDPFSPVPTIGASGAIAGVMGAYLLKLPTARIRTLIFLFIFITTVDIPAFFLLAYWFLIQFLNGVGQIGHMEVNGGGVAWFAHVGGFLAGMALILLMPEQRRVRTWY